MAQLMSRKQQKVERTIIFLHMPKAAGSTLRQIIHRQYSSSSVVTLSAPDGEIDPEFESLPIEEKRKIKVIQGHTPFGIHESIPQPSTYFTVLRNPTDRLISYYYYVLQSPDNEHYHAVTSLGLDLNGYIKSGLLDDNGQTRRLAGIAQPSKYWVGNKPEVECTKETLEVAKQNLMNYFSVVGVVDRFCESLWLIKKEFGWKLPFFTKTNVTNIRPTMQELGMESLDIIMKHTEFDHELYDFARKLYERRIQQEGRAFHRELKAFMLLNRIYGTIFPAYQSMKHGFGKRVGK